MEQPERDVSPVIGIVNRTLMYAIRDGADVVRREPGEKIAEVFHRVADEEKPQMKMPIHVLAPVVARIKKMADIPLDEPGAGRGRIRLKLGEKLYNVHVSTEPTEFGERVEMLFERALPSADQ